MILTTSEIVVGNIEKIHAFWSGSEIYNIQENSHFNELLLVTVAVILNTAAQNYSWA